MLSCDQTPIDALLQKHFSPYFDRRWHLLTARQEAARAFSQRHNNVTILNRPDIKECTFEVKGTKKSYPFRWQPRDEKDTAAIRTINNPTYKLPGVKELSPGVLWITASDFRLNSTEVNQRQQQLLNDLENFKTKKVIIFDTRLNAGGSSSHGFNIISRALDDDEKNYIFREWDLRFSGADAEFRASWRLYWNWDYKLQHVLKTQGPNSSPAKFLSAAKNKVKKSLENGQPYFKQSEIFEHASNNNNIDTKNQSTEWKSSKQIALLTSSRCSSACLDFVDMAKLIPGLIHVGAPTNADTSYIEIAEMQSRYFGEIFEFMVPAKKWNKRMRQDNIPYIPDIIYAGNIYDNLAVESWVLEQIQAIPQQAASN